MCVNIIYIYLCLSIQLIYTIMTLALKNYSPLSLLRHSVQYAGTVCLRMKHSCQPDRALDQQGKNEMRENR